MHLLFTNYFCAACYHIISTFAFLNQLSQQHLFAAPATRIPTGADTRPTSSSNQPLKRP